MSGRREEEEVGNGILDERSVIYVPVSGLTNRGGRRSFLFVADCQMHGLIASAGVGSNLILSARQIQAPLLFHTPNPIYVISENSLMHALFGIHVTPIHQRPPRHNLTGSLFRFVLPSIARCVPIVTYPCPLRQLGLHMPFIFSYDSGIALSSSPVPRHLALR